MATILVLDDRAANRELLITLLGYRGHRLLESDNGADGLAITRRERPDLVIADILMPGMDGYEFVRALRADPAIAATRVVFYTATYLEDEARTLADRCGVTQIITKPAEPEAILRIVDEALATGFTPPPAPAEDDFDREHLRLVSDKLKHKADELEREVEERRRAEAEVRAHARRLEALRALDQAILTAESPAELAAAAVHHVRRNVACDRVEVVLTDAEEGAEQVLAVDPAPVVTAAAERATLRAALGDAGVLLADDLARPDRPAALAPLAAGGMRAALALALTGRQGPVGLLLLAARQPATFAAEQVALAREMAAPLAIGLEQLRLDERIRRHAAELEDRVRERTTRLQQTLEELEAFSYSVSHDLRAPLRQLRAFVDVLRDEHGAHLGADGLACLERVTAAGARMDELITDLLGLARVTRDDLAIADVDLGHLAAAILAELRAAQPTRQVETRVAAHVTVRGDGRLLRLALENLLANAWKYTGRRPRAHIEFGVAERDGGRAYFVRDDGAGFDPAHAARLFTPFQRLHSSAEFEGTGVGLAIVQRVVRRHGGEVWAEAAVERGATFWFTLGDG